jgi:hypothetical protein
MPNTVQEQLVKQSTTKRKVQPDLNGNFVFECIFENKTLSVYSLSITTKHWKTISPNHRYAEVAIPSLSNEVYDEGMVLVFLDEFNKRVILPFVFRQQTNTATIKLTYGPERIYLNIYGKYIPSINTSFCFKVLIIQKDGIEKNPSLNWKNYNQVKKALKIREKKRLS